MIIEKECVVRARIENIDDGVIQCCCGYSMFPKSDLDLLRDAGWKKQSEVSKEEK